MCLASSVPSLLTLSYEKGICHGIRERNTRDELARRAAVGMKKKRTCGGNKEQSSVGMEVITSIGEEGIRIG